MRSDTFIVFHKIILSSFRDDFGILLFIHHIEQRLCLLYLQFRKINYNRAILQKRQDMANLNLMCTFSYTRLCFLERIKCTYIDSCLFLSFRPAPHVNDEGLWR